MGTVLISVEWALLYELEFVKKHLQNVWKGLV